jgi:hypothetical protein
MQSAQNVYLALDGHLVTPKVSRTRHSCRANRITLITHMLSPIPEVLNNGLNAFDWDYDFDGPLPASPTPTLPASPGTAKAKRAARKAFYKAKYQLLYTHWNELLPQAKLAYSHRVALPDEARQVTSVSDCTDPCFGDLCEVGRSVHSVACVYMDCK